jgi:prepilin-type N-terminal cleavage/methylation domain-containing protein
MKLKDGKRIERSKSGARSAFTLVEILVASSIGLVITAGAMVFMQFAGLSISGSTSQSMINQRAGNAIQFIQNRARSAVFVTNDATGNVLSLAFDDDQEVDSDGDGKTYNDRNHFEQFKFIGVNGTNAVATNMLVYIANTAVTNQQVLIAGGVHNLPNCNIFTVTNGSTIVIRFGIVDGYGADRYQSIDVQATAVPLNRAVNKNVITILQ